MKKTWVWTILAAPAAVIGARYFADMISYGQAIHLTGQWSVGLLLITLSLTPLRRIFKASAWFRGLLTHRRALGVASFAYALAHTLIYLERKWGADLIIKEGLEPDLATGWLALAIFGVLAATSNNVSVKKLGGAWRRLHRSVYAATVLTFAHWILATFNPATAVAVLGLFLGVQLIRLKRS